MKKPGHEPRVFFAPRVTRHALYLRTKGGQGGGRLQVGHPDLLVVDGDFYGGREDVRV